MGTFPVEDFKALPETKAMSTRSDEEKPRFTDLDHRRREMERNWQLRQENVLPLSAARNEGWFYGFLSKGTQRLTTVQRLGLFIIGFAMVGTIALLTFADAEQFQFHGIGPSLKSINSALPDISLLALPLILLLVGFGLRLLWVALKPSSHPSRHHESR
jgi:hypothetical protein